MPPVTRLTAKLGNKKPASEAGLARDSKEHGLHAIHAAHAFLVWGDDYGLTVMTTVSV